MRRTGATPGLRFKGASPLKSPGPSPATFRNRPDTPQHAIQPRENQQRVAAPTEGRAVFNKPQNPEQIGHALTRTARGNTKTPAHGIPMQRPPATPVLRSPATPVNAGRPVSGVGRIQQAQAENRRRVRKGGK